MPRGLLRQTFEDLSSVVDPDTGFSKSVVQQKAKILEALQTDWLGEQQGTAKKVLGFITRNTTPQVLSVIAVWPQASQAVVQAVFAAWLCFLKEDSPQFVYRAELGQHAVALAEHKANFDAVVNESKLSEPSHIAQFLIKKETWLPWLRALQTRVQARIGTLYAQASTQYDSAYGRYVPTFENDCKRLNLVLPAETDLNRQVDLLNAFEQAEKSEHATLTFQRANTTRVFQKMIAVLITHVNEKVQEKCNTPAPQWKLTASPYARQDLGHLKTAIAYLIRLADCIQRVPAVQAADIFGQDSKATAEPSTEIEKQPGLFAKLACLLRVPVVAEAKSACEAKQLGGQVAVLTGSIEGLRSDNESLQQKITQLETALQESKASQAELEKKWLDDQPLRHENERLEKVVKTTKQQNINLMNQNAALREEQAEDKKTIDGFSEQISRLKTAHEAEKAQFQSQLAARAEPIQKFLTYLGPVAFIVSLFFGAMRLGLFTLIEKEKDHFSGMLTVVLLLVAAVAALVHCLLDHMAKPVAGSNEPQLLLQL